MPLFLIWRLYMAYYRSYSDYEDALFYYILAELLFSEETFGLTAIGSPAAISLFGIKVLSGTGVKLVC